MIAGAISFDAQIGGDLASKLVADTTRFHSSTCQHIITQPQIGLYATTRQEDGPGPIIWSTPEGSTLCFVGEASFRNDRLGGRLASARSIFDIQNASPPGRWIACELNLLSPSIRLVGDPLALSWLYIRRIDSGYIFAPDFGAVARLRAGDLSVNHGTILCELTAGYSPDDSTIFNEISILPAGSVVELSPRGIKTVRSQTATYGDRYAGVSTTEKFDALDAAFDSIVAELLSVHEDTPALSLSAGYDSRYALALLSRQGKHPDLFTFGNPLSQEVKGAQQVSANAGSFTTVFDIPSGKWSQWRDMIQTLGNAGTVQWCGWGYDWLEFLRGKCKSCIIGYLGDALSGKHLGRAAPDNGDWLTSWLHWSTDGGWIDSPYLRPESRKHAVEILKQRFQDLSLAQAVAFPHQKALHLDLYGRQRRWVASQPNIISRFLSPVIPFYNRRMLDFWGNLPVDDLLGQRLYLSYAQDRFPRLFPPLVHRKPNLRTRLAHGLHRRFAQIAGKGMASAPIVIDHARAISPNREEIQSLVKRTGHILEPSIDVKHLATSIRDGSFTRGLSTGNLIRFINVMHLLDVPNASRSVEVSEV